MKKAILIIFSMISILLTLKFSLVFKNRLALRYNTEGNFYDENSAIVYHQQSILVYGIVAFIFFIATLILANWTLKTLGND